jgi:hypothetical protein
MEIHEREYFYLKNYNEIGKLEMNYGNFREADPLLPIFKVVKIADKEFRLKSGYLTFDNRFIETPIKIQYIIVDTIICKQVLNTWNYTGLKTSHYEDRFDVTFHLYNINYSDKVEIELKELTSPHEIGSYFNALNISIHRGKQIRDFEKGRINELTKEFSFPSFVALVNKLEFKVYENSVSRPGKDNYFWEEIEIINPNFHSYIKTLVIDSLRSENFSNQKFDSVSFVEEKIVIHTHQSSAWSASFQRREVSDNESMNNLTKQIARLLPAFVMKRFSSFAFQTYNVFPEADRSFYLPKKNYTIKDLHRIETNLLLTLQRHGYTFDSYIAFNSNAGTKVVDIKITEIKDLEQHAIYERGQVLSGLADIKLNHTTYTESYKATLAIIVDQSSKEIIAISGLEILDSFKIDGF